MAEIIPIHHGSGLPRTLTKEQLVALVQELMAEGGRMVVKEHCYDRMEERDISMAQIRQVLRRGSVTRGPTWTDHRNWGFTMQADTAGQLITAGGAIDVDLLGQSILILTVY